jgi:hypothetical protein
MADLVELNPKIYRKGTMCAPRAISFCFRGGIGDFVCFMPSMIWIAKTSPHVMGSVLCPEYFAPVARLVFEQYGIDWPVFTDKKDLPPGFVREMGVYPNATGVPLVDLGFLYFAHTSPPPRGADIYPRVRFPQWRHEGGPIAVVTAGASHDNRKLPPRAMNGILNHLRAKGMTPVVLGKSEVGSRAIAFDEGYDFSQTFDLINKTTLIEAGSIMQAARVVIGVDSGLLHLAAMTAVPLVFGYTVASPATRRPRRVEGVATIGEIYPDPDVLTCTFCQDKMRHLVNHDFKNCLYKDNACVSHLDDPQPWNDLIDHLVP